MEGGRVVVGKEKGGRGNFGDSISCLFFDCRVDFPFSFFDDKQGV